MSRGACNCCSAPPCSEPVLQYRSASTQVCGVQKPDTDPVEFYQKVVVVAGGGAAWTRTTTEYAITEGQCSPTTTVECLPVTTTVTETLTEGGSFSETFESSREGGFGDAVYIWGYDEVITRTGETTYNKTTVTTPDPADPCLTVTKCTGNYTSSIDVTITDTVRPYPGPGASPGPKPEDFTFLQGGTESGAWNGEDCIFRGTASGYNSVIGPNGPFAISDESITFPEEAVITTEGPTYAPTYEASTTYSNPTMPEFVEYPAWPGESEDELLDGQGYSETASKSGTTLRKIEWRLKHPPSGTCYLKAWLAITETPTAGEPTITESDYEWQGTGNPCLADSQLSAAHESNAITGEATEQLPPAENGTVKITRTKFSCVEGYEPDISDPENKQPNGFPDPSWEADAP